jgi:hypothetical protein
MAQFACVQLNTFQEIADAAKGSNDNVIRLVATRNAFQGAKAFMELALGRTVNINATLRSQKDVPDFDKLSPDKRAQLEAIVAEMEGRIVEAEVVNPDGPSHPETGQ